MDPISNVDRIAILLRQKLLERARSNRSEASAASTSSEAPDRRQKAALDAARALAAVNDIDEHQRRRALIQGALVDQFGSDLVNDAQFQQLVEKVASAIEKDENSAAALTSLLQKLRHG